MGIKINGWTVSLFIVCILWAYIIGFTVATKRHTNYLDQISLGLDSISIQDSELETKQKEFEFLAFENGYYLGALNQEKHGEIDYSTFAKDSIKIMKIINLKQ